MSHCRIACALLAFMCFAATASAQVKSYLAFAPDAWALTQIVFDNNCRPAFSFVGPNGASMLFDRHYIAGFKPDLQKDGGTWIPTTAHRDPDPIGNWPYTISLSANGIITGEMFQPTAQGDATYTWRLDLNTGAFRFESYDAPGWACRGRATTEGIIPLRIEECPFPTDPIDGWYRRIGACSTRPLIRYYNANPNILDHFYTADFNEFRCGWNGWLYESEIGRLPDGNNPTGHTAELFRFWNGLIGDHLYTTNPAEVGPGYEPAGIIGYIFTQPLPGTIPLYRWYSVAASDHLYTTDENEQPVGYTREGITGWVYPGGGTQSRCFPRRYGDIPFEKMCGYPGLTNWDAVDRLWSTDFSDGSRLELTCESRGRFSLGSYKLTYTRAAAASQKSPWLRSAPSIIAECMYEDGRNAATYVFAADGDNDGKPDTLISTEWTNVDGGENDPALPMDALPLDPVDKTAALAVFLSGEPLLDSLRFTFDAVSDKLSWIDTKYAYPDDTYQIDPERVESYIDSNRHNAVAAHVIDPPVSNATNQSFNSFLDIIAASNSATPMGWMHLCDLNLDGRCDSTDTSIADSSAGTCAGSSAFVAKADLDQSGCIEPGELDSVSQSFQKYASTIGSDLTPPTLVLPQSVVVDTRDQGGAVAFFDAFSLDSVGGDKRADCTPRSGHLFPVGTTHVVCSSVDLSGNSSVGSFPVSVRLVDDRPPTLSLPGNIAADATGPAGAVVHFAATATDDLDGPVPVACAPASGDTFPVGSTTVSCSASDLAGNATTGTFSVTIRATPAVSWFAPDTIVQGTPLSSLQLNATANVPGRFVYTPRWERSSRLVPARCCRRRSRLPTTRTTRRRSCKSPSMWFQ